MILRIVFLRLITLSFLVLIFDDAHVLRVNILTSPLQHLHTLYTYMYPCMLYTCACSHHLQQYQRHQEFEEEPEPEWMEFGPTDRFDVIELKGFDKNELEKESESVDTCSYNGIDNTLSGCPHSSQICQWIQIIFVLAIILISAKSSHFVTAIYVLHVHCSYMYIADHKKRSKSVSTPISRNETPKWEEEIVAENKDEKVEGDGAVFMEEKPAVSEGRKEGAPRREKEGGREKKDNEYILDGFDFSTGMCVLYVATRQYGRRGRSLTIIVCMCAHLKKNPAIIISRDDPDRPYTM